MHSFHRNLTLRTKMMLIFLASITPVLLLVNGIFCFQSSRYFREEMAQSLKCLAVTAATFIQADEHDAVYREKSEKSRKYADIQKTLLRFKASNPEIRFVYTMVPVDQKIWHYVVDAEPVKGKDHSPLGSEFDIKINPGFIEGLKGAYASTKFSVDPVFGTLLTGCAPILDSQGKSHGIVGVDISAARIVSKESILLKLALWSLLLGLFVSFLVSFWIARLLNRPIGELVRGSREAASGNLAVRVPEKRTDELGELAHAFNSMLGDLARQREELKEQERMAQELATARKIQQAMLPTEAPISSRLNIDFYAESASEVGGDYFDFLPLEDGQMAIAIGDVTGHGVPAALLMAMVKSCLHTQVLSNYRVSDVMEVANNAVFKST
ncbi:MAG TPA: HAMP domain-containing protein, partial [Chroococcales cyanobacterium]